MESEREETLRDFRDQAEELGRRLMEQAERAESEVSGSWLSDDLWNELQALLRRWEEIR